MKTFLKLLIYLLNFLWYTARILKIPLFFIYFIHMGMLGIVALISILKPETGYWATYLWHMLYWSIFWVFFYGYQPIDVKK